MGVGVAFRAMREAFANRFVHGPRVLVYHRVTSLTSDPQWLAVRPGNFASQLEVLSQEANVVPLDELRRLQKSGRIPRRTVAITFDDGYADNLLEAAPLLTATKLSATVFVSACVEPREFYWDELDRLILLGSGLPSAFTLEVAGVRHEFVIEDEANDGSSHLSAQHFWNATMPALTCRQKCYLRLCALLKPLDDPDRQAALERLRATLGATGLVRPSHRRLSVQELRQLAATPGISIGAHTVTHAMLSRLPLRRKEEEIRHSKELLEQALASPVSSFAYPYGSRKDFDAESVDLVRGSGFAYACANYSGVIKAGTDPFRLPRELVRDWTGPEFRARLRRWLND